MSVPVNEVSSNLTDFFLGCVLKSALWTNFTYLFPQAVAFVRTLTQRAVSHQIGLRYKLNELVSEHFKIYNGTKVKIKPLF